MPHPLDELLQSINHSNDEVLQHFGVKGMRWGQRRALKRQGYNPKQIKYMNKQYKRDTEFGQRATALNKIAGKRVLKEKLGLQIDAVNTGVSTGLNAGTSRKGLIKRIKSGSSKKKIEKAIGRPMKGLGVRSQLKARKIVSKFDNVSIRVVTKDNINKPFDDWTRISV